MSDAVARVLVVDDNDATLYSTSRVLRAAGFEVAEGASGEEALDLALKDIDLMLLDVNLPDLHGFEVCRPPATGSAHREIADHPRLRHFRHRFGQSARTRLRR